MLLWIYQFFNFFYIQMWVFVQVKGSTTYSCIIALQSNWILYRYQFTISGTHQQQIFAVRQAYSRFGGRILQTHNNLHFLTTHDRTESLVILFKFREICLFLGTSDDADVCGINKRRRFFFFFNNITLNLSSFAGMSRKQDLLSCKYLKSTCFMCLDNLNKMNSQQRLKF